MPRIQPRMMLTCPTLSCNINGLTALPRGEAVRRVDGARPGAALRRFMVMEGAGPRCPRWQAARFGKRTGRYDMRGAAPRPDAPSEPSTGTTTRLVIPVNAPSVVRRCRRPAMVTTPVMGSRAGP